MKTKFKITEFIFCWLAILSYVGNEALADSFENITDTSIDQILVSSLTRSLHYTVQDRVYFDGRFFHFEVDVKDETVSIVSRALLRLRLHEITTIANYRTNSSMQRQNVSNRTDLVNGFTNKGITDDEGFYSQINVRGTSGKERAKQKKLNPYSHTSYDPNQIELFKRNIASRLHIDPYTSNLEIQSLLEEQAVLGIQGKPINNSFVIERDPETKLSIGETDRIVREFMRNSTAEELDNLSLQRLRELGIESQLIKDFFSNNNYSPRHRAYITAYLSTLDGIDNPGAVISQAVNAKSEHEALSYEQLMRMITLYHNSIASIVRIDKSKSKIVALLSNGQSVLFLPYDMLWWGASMSELLNSSLNNKSGANINTVLVSGIITPEMKSRLKSRNITYHENFLFDGSIAKGQ